MNLIDTHCHIHSSNFEPDPEQTIKDAKLSGVNKLICVGTDLVDSTRAVDFVNGQNNCWASIGIHPHQSKNYINEQDKLAELKELSKSPRVVAIGECGLDYFYDHSPKKDQIKIFEYQLNLAAERKLPLIFHVRNAFEDFWPIIENFKNITGVVHSFTAGIKILDQTLNHNLMVGLNGIMTFTKDHSQLEAAKKVPIDRILLETDAPFLAPQEFRGKTNQPKYITSTAKFLAELRGESVNELSEYTTKNAIKLFNLS